MVADERRHKSAPSVADAGLPGWFTDDAHLLAMRIYYEDTDAAGLVYHANYLKFAERARSEALFALGWDQRRLFEEDGIVFVVRRCEVDYRAPARLGDMILVRTRVGDMSGPRFVMDQTVTRDGTDLVNLAVTIVCIGRDGRPTRVPEPIRRALATLRGAAA